jgi:hypothetical protein
MADAERGRKRGRRETRNALPGRVRRRKRRLSRCGATARTREFLAAVPVPSASTTARTNTHRRYFNEPAPKTNRSLKVITVLKISKCGLRSDDR